ncbi:S41 family peptidase [Undibacterium sp.]|jgi:hypothetical protein|uniref:S41 family peptidase n=1 Tax=Undibacterium sp. TaxID=1914977 RepID=UPI002CC1F0D5|nr:S41 family peptidase [Undibacterium sp.]HTD07146.1 S41 family peptidase [Undibacterium sp.]
MLITSVRYKLVAAALTALVLATPALSAPAVENSIPRAVARDLVNQTIALVEKDGLPPSSAASYAEAKRLLLSEFDSDAPVLERNTVYADLKNLLGTLDADGHSNIFTAPQTNMIGGIASTQAALSKPLVQNVRTEHGMVLRLTPPQVTDITEKGRQEYVSGILKNLSSDADAASACALVVDLTEQKGGNAWPPLILMQPLFSDGNMSRFVKRDNLRLPIFSTTILRELAEQNGSGQSNPLQRFAVQDIAIITGPDTSSAGEMLTMALLGEGARVRSFGWKTKGFMTANRTFTMPDGALLVLSVSRYALGDQAAVRGGITPMEPAAPGESLEGLTQRASTWAAERSQLCKSQLATAH